MKKRLLALALALMLVLTLLPSMVMAKEESFADVRPADWYYNAVCFAAENGLMSGTGTGFAPDAPTTRAMLWTILSRLDGQTAKHTGADWYAAAQLWAVRNDISDGTEPDGTITREQLAAMLYRFAQRKGLVRAAAPADLSAFTDAASVSAYAQEAMQWAVANGLIAGMDGRLVPQGSATRAQIAQILSRMCEKWSLLPQSNAAILAGAGAFQQPEHKHTWGAAAPNGDGTHTSICECGERMTEYCTLVRQGETESWSCSVCGFTVKGTADAGVSTWKELKEAVEAGKSPIYLAGDIAIEDAIRITTNTTFFGGGHTLTRAEGYTDGMFKEGKHYSDLTLNDLRLDGKNMETDLLEVAVVENNPGGKLTIKNCTIENFNAQQIIYSRWAANCTEHNGHPDPSTDRVCISDTVIRNNVLTTTATKNNNYDNKMAGTMFWVARSDLNLKNVTITDNTMTSSTSGNWIRGGGNLFFVKDNSTLTADELFVSNNKTLCLLNSWYSDNCHHHFNSGYIKDCTGQIDIYGDVTIGESMTIELAGNYTFWFTNSSGTRTLTNNGTILARVAQHDWSKTKAVYKGTGTVKELAEGSFDIQ